MALLRLVCKGQHRVGPWATLQKCKTMGQEINQLLSLVTEWVDGWLDSTIGNSSPKNLDWTRTQSVRAIKDEKYFSATIQGGFLLFYKIQFNIRLVFAK